VKFLYLVFLSLWSAISLSVGIMQTIKLCKDTETKAVIADSFILVFLLGLLAQFIAVGVQVIGG
jgi:hypothetical protein